MIKLLGVCPITGLARKVQYDFMIFRSAKQIIIDCEVFYVGTDDKIINTERVKPYKKRFMASDDLVDATTGVLVFPTKVITTVKTPSEIAGEPDIITNVETIVPYPKPTMTQFEFYDKLGKAPVALYSKIEEIIHLRHSEGKFDI